MMKEMIDLAEIYNGTLEGYVIPMSVKDRDDARITFETLILQISARVAAILNKKLKPDEFSLEMTVVIDCGGTKSLIITDLTLDKILTVGRQSSSKIADDLFA